MKNIHAITFQFDLFSWVKGTHENIFTRILLKNIFKKRVLFTRLSMTGYRHKMLSCYSYLPIV